MLALLVCSLLLAAPASGDATLFAKIEGFKITDGPTRFGPDNLFEAIDGGHYNAHADAVAAQAIVAYIDAHGLLTAANHP